MTVSGPLQTFAKLAPRQRGFPKPAIRGFVQQGLARQGQQCGLSGLSLRCCTQLLIQALWPLHRDHLSRSAALHEQDGTVASGIWP